VRRRSWKLYLRAVQALSGGITHQQAARRVGVHDSTVSRWAADAVTKGLLTRTARNPALYVQGPAYTAGGILDGVVKRLQATLDAYLSMEGLALSRLKPPRGVVEQPPQPPTPTPIRFHDLTITFEVLSGPSPDRIRWQRTWDASGTIFAKTTMPMLPYHDEEGAAIILAWGPQGKTFEVIYPPLYVFAIPGGDLTGQTRSLIESLRDRARHWITHELGYQLGTTRIAKTPHLATQHLGQRLLVPGVGYIRLSEEGDAWIDESVGPELETTKPAVQQGWVDYATSPEALLATLLGRLDGLTRAVSTLAARLDRVEAVLVGETP